jgi:protein tyrosine phosphatase (PTP) superfamily phosphohydrolase (DUF442 family)
MGGTTVCTRRRAAPGAHSGALVAAVVAAAAAAAAACHGDRGSPASPPAAASPSGADRAAPRNDLPGLANFAKVSDHLWRGEQPSREGFATLKSLGVKTVVNLRTSRSDRADLAGLGLDLVELDVEPHDLDDHEVLAFLKVATDPARQPVFVHCKHGADRTGAMVAAYRMVAQGWAREDAVAELPRFGFHEVWVNIRRYVERVDAGELRRRLADAEPPAVVRVD